MRQALAYSLRASSYPLRVLITPDVSKSSRAKLARVAQVVEVQPLASPFSTTVGPLARGSKQQTDLHGVHRSTAHCAPGAT